MSFDFVKIFKEIDLHKNDLDIDNFMTTIINHCHEMQPNKSWDLFKELDYTTEVKSLAAHVIDSLEKEASPFIEQGFWFGLSDNGYLYFAVSDQYIAEEDNLDWMSEARTYYPEQGAFSSEILRSIEDLADETELDNYAEYPLFLAYALKLAQASMNHYKTAYPERKVGYSIGYDSGDFITGGWI
ncbi:MULTISPECIES: hypothetical protein [Acinetobacter]|jgi:hypothetical protein|uniref:DUF4303 domain-containing protein n=1 Tax=Acinetobacter lwoffii TaxID=28090 RepID=A0A385H7Y2_ACILW|nr:hypothetical protein [Acinetobacter lwoffii]ENU64246.1 hypothetical protein F980_00009 [Acinetobacter lwoffii NIPH 715]MCU4616593.1 hypothetical protein [Acinetobacter lwoffii]